MAQALRLENEKKWEELPGTFVENPYYDIPALDLYMRGIDEIMEFYRDFDAALPDLKTTETCEVYDVGILAVETTVEGTHGGEFLGVPATGRRLKFQIAGFIPFDTDQEPGKMIAERVYLDTESILRQMRGEEDAVSNGEPGATE